MKFLKKIFFFLCGTLSLLMAYIGLILPGIPGVPFVLLSGYFYVSSSNRMHTWLLKQKFFGKIVRDFQEKEELPRKYKYLMILQVWFSSIFTIVVLSPDLFWQMGIVSSAIFFTILINRIGND